MFYMNLFLIFSILGYLLETITMFILNIEYNSSVLYGPWTLIYGIASIIMIIIYILIKKINLDLKKEKIVYFFCISLILTILEGIAGYVIEFTQNKIYWNYDNLKFNIGHYMSLEIAFLWGGLATFSMYFIIPKIKRIVNKIPKTLTYLLILLIVVDIIVSFLL